MKPIHYDADLCIMTKFFGLIAGKWKPILLHLIERDVSRFSQMLRYMPTISKKILTEQLRELEADGLICRVELKAKAPKVVVYRLSDKGLSLRKLIDDIIAWSMKHLRDDIPEEFVRLFVHHYPEMVNDLPWIGKCTKHEERISSTITHSAET